MRLNRIQKPTALALAKLCFFIVVVLIYVKSIKIFVHWTVPAFRLCDDLNKGGAPEFMEAARQSSRSLCGCVGEKFCIKKAELPLVNSTCSLEASLLGPNQKVISFSLHKTTENKFMGYLPGILENLPLQQQFYPNWVIRVYTNVSLDKRLCNIVCANRNIYFCNSTNLPGLGSVEDMDPNAWRFLALGDPTVRIFVSRDLDSRLGLRERAAVRQWEESLFPLHAMRDYTLHQNPMMAGMWGADNQKMGETFAKKLHSELRNAQILQDQVLLDRVIYQKYKAHMMIHDSYMCKHFNDSIPFPTQRSSKRDFVGTRIWDSYQTPECPVECRPTYGKNWTDC